jgi:hypothetical protein
MSKSPDSTTKKTFELIEAIEFTASVPLEIGNELRAKLNHDLKASCNAFALLIEELEFNLSRPLLARQETKLRQLRMHLENNRKVIDLMCHGLINQAVKD